MLYIFILTFSFKVKKVVAKWNHVELASSSLTM